MENNVQFDELRNQIAVLKKKLDDQEIVNDRLLRQTMKTKVDKIINVVEIKTIGCGIVAILLCPALYEFSGLSLPFCVATCLMMIFCIVGTRYIHRPLHKTDLMSADMATVATILERFRRQYDFWLHYITPTLLIPWVSWACYEFAEANGLDVLSKDGIMFCMPLLLGGIIGTAIGYRMHRKAVNTAKSIIEQIEE